MLKEKRKKSQLTFYMKRRFYLCCGESLENKNGINPKASKNKRQIKNNTELLLSVNRVHDSFSALFVLFEHLRLQYCRGKCEGGQRERKG